MALEKVIQESILNYLNNEVPNCRAENVSGSANQKGRPDINAVWQGQSLRIEVKSPDNNYMPTKLQIANLKRWAKAGAVCLVVWSLEDVKSVIPLEISTSNKFLVTRGNFKGWWITESGVIVKYGYKEGEVK